MRDTANRQRSNPFLQAVTPVALVMAIRFRSARALRILPAIFMVLGNHALAAGSATTAGPGAKGREAFVRQCALCHTIDKGDSNRYGPNLFGIMGRKAGTVPGFEYSTAFGAVARWNWDVAKMGAWIGSPKAMIPGSKMDVFQGIAASDRNDIIAYIAEHGGHAS